MVSLYASEAMNTGDIAYIDDKTGGLIIDGRSDDPPVLVALIDIEPGDLITFDPVSGGIVSIERDGEMVWVVT